MVFEVIVAIPCDIHGGIVGRISYVPTILR